MKTFNNQRQSAVWKTVASLIGCGALLWGGIDGHAQGRGATGGTGGNGGGRGRSSNNAVNTSVIAVADEHSNSLVVAAPDDLLPMIKQLVDQLDQPVTDITELKVFHLKNADPVEIADTLATLFPDETKSGTGNNPQQQFRFGGGPFGALLGGRGGGQNANAGTAASDRMKKQTRVLAVPDQRTSSLIVSAASTMMPQIAEMIHQLDLNPARKQKVYVYSLDNADPQQVAPILQEMFQRSTTSANRNNANQNSALSQRIQSNTQSMSTGQGNNSNFGSGIGGGGGGIGGGAGGLR
jgi:type II secretory pathway component GspD/PulD (secretin)